MTGCLIKRMAGRQDLEQDVSRSQNLRMVELLDIRMAGDSTAGWKN